MRSHSVLIGPTLLLSVIATSLSVLPLGALTQVTSTQENAGGGVVVDWDVVAQIREEGLQRSQIANTLSYMTDVLGARLTNSIAMDNAQGWADRGDEEDRADRTLTASLSWSTASVGTTSTSLSTC